MNNFIFIRATEKLTWLPLLLARLTVGYIFLTSGWGKIQNIPKVIEFFSSLQLPTPLILAYVVSYTEFSCGLLLMLGLITKIASIPLIIVMTVAIITAKQSEITDLSALLFLPEYLFICILLILLVYGAGVLSVDNLLGNYLENRGPKGFVD